MTPRYDQSGGYGIVASEDSVSSTISVVKRLPKSRFATFWCTAHHQARQDLRARGWRGAFWVLCYVVFAGLIYGFGVLAMLSSPGLITTSRMTACAPDGLFYTNPGDFSFWHGTGFFQVTLGHGELTFTQAKVIDLIWDVIIGRGGQALLTLVSWKVFTQYVTTSMQVAPVTFSTFRTIFVHGEPTVVGVWRLLRDFSRRHGLQSRVAMVFMVAIMVFILAFPTLASAMTGYSANVAPFVQVANGSSYLPFQEFRPLYFVIHDGDRINERNDFKVMNYVFGSEYEALGGSSRGLGGCFSYYGSSTLNETKACEVLGNVIKYVIKYGSGGDNVNSTFANSTLPPPTLNITTYSLPQSYIHSFEWQDSITDSTKFFSDRERMAWVQDDIIYNTTDMNALGLCQPTKTYNWGFSFIQLIMMIIILMIWLIGTYTMYLRSHITLKKRGKSQDDVVGEYQAIFELSNAMQIELNQHTGSEEAKDVSHLTESQLRQRITKDLKGGSISFVSDSCPSSRNSTWRFRTSLKKDAWWITFLIMATPPAIYLGFMPAMTWSGIVLPFLVVFVMYVRTTGKSGAVLVFWPVLLLTLVAVVLVMTAITGRCFGCAAIGNTPLLYPVVT